MQRSITKLNISTRRTILSLAVAGALSMAMGTMAVASEDPYNKADDTWITLNGEVVSVDRNSFVMDYGDGEIIVEMDDGDRDADAYKLLPGDRILVTGQIDDDFFTRTTIEATSVYVDNISTTFFAHDADDYAVATAVGYLWVPAEENRAVVQGTVTEVDDDEFMIDTGMRKIEVNVDGLAYNPLDDEGYQRIEVGDRVKVFGEVDHEWFGDHEIEADTVVELPQKSS